MYNMFKGQSLYEPIIDFKLTKAQHKTFCTLLLLKIKKMLIPNTYLRKM